MNKVILKFLIIGITIAAFTLFIAGGVWAIVKGNKQKMDDQDNNAVIPGAMAPVQETPSLQYTLSTQSA